MSEHAQPVSAGDGPHSDAPPQSTPPEAPPGDGTPIRIRTAA